MENCVMKLWSGRNRNEKFLRRLDQEIEVVMKRWILGIVCLLMGISVSAEEDQYRLFTVADGRAIEARILRVRASDGSVQIEPRKKRSVWVKMDVFCEQDQAYIQNWLAADQFLSSSLRLSIKKKSSGKDGVYYELTVNNQTEVALRNLEVNYLLYVEKQGFNGKSDSDRYESGTFNLRQLAAKSKEVVITKITNETRTHTTKTERYTNYSNGGSSTYTQQVQVKATETKVKGVWFHIQGPALDGQSAVRELCLPSNFESKVDSKRIKAARKRITDE
jgi:hypothetical protein